MIGLSYSMHVLENNGQLWESGQIFMSNISGKVWTISIPFYKNFIRAWWGLFWTPSLSSLSVGFCFSSAAAWM